MPPKKSIEPELSLAPVDSNSPRPRLSKLIIKNFRTIGTTPVEVDLNDVVVLVGPNNAGKGSILQAYELVMNNGINRLKKQILKC